MVALPMPASLPPWSHRTRSSDAVPMGGADHGAAARPADGSVDISFTVSAVDYESVFRLHYQPMVRSLAVVAGNREDAADAVQEAFTKAYVRWKKISTYDDPASWIRRVAINKLRDGHRSRKHGDALAQRIGSRESRDGAAEGPETEVVEAASKDEAGRRLARALQSLPRQQRAALSLFYLEQLSVAEVARSMGLSDGAVKFHLHQGRDALRVRLDPRAS